MVAAVALSAVVHLVEASAEVALAAVEQALAGKTNHTINETIKEKHKNSNTLNLKDLLKNAAERRSLLEELNQLTGKSIKSISILSQHLTTYEDIDKLRLIHSNLVDKNGNPIVFWFVQDFSNKNVYTDFESADPVIHAIKGLDNIVLDMAYWGELYPSVEFKITSDGDYYMYLSMTLTWEDNQWKVSEYGLEG